MGKISLTTFYQKIIKKLFIGNNIRLWGIFMILFISRGWEIIGRLIFYLTF